ncbi:MAG: NAD-dependent epimerase/dehydratase family protein [Verrucomicrobia bacterium]|nr:NAD-dependent epimerase/dehydratase family protein [Verrucomicrobiota bacterium]
MTNGGQPVLVTGAGGFVGSRLVRELVSRGIPVRAMVRDLRKTGELQGLDIEMVQADMKDAASLARAVEGVGGVYHIAALFRQAGLPDAEFFDVNVEGTRRLLDASIAAGVRRFVHCSTVGVLGHVENPPADEQTPYNPGDVYQRSKMEGEKIALDYFRSGRLPGVVIRPAMIWGPGDTRTLKMFHMIARGRFFYVGRGMALVHFIDVRDLARAFVLAMEKTERSGEVYIIAGRQSLPLRSLAEAIAGRLAVLPPRLCLPVKPMQWLGSLCEAVCTPFGIQPPLYRRRVDFYTKSRSFNGAKADRELGFRPAKSLVEEVDDIIADYKARGWL